MAISFFISTKGSSSSVESKKEAKKPNHPSNTECAIRKPSVFGAESDAEDSDKEVSGVHPLSKRPKLSHKGAPQDGAPSTSVASEFQPVKVDYKEYDLSTDGLDPELYQYDSLEDNKEEESNDPKNLVYLGFAPSNSTAETPKPAQKDSQYMKGLIRTARHRQIERDIAFDKQQLKADLETGEEVGEVFVTGAYKRKLEERKRFEEEQRRKDEEDLKNSGKSVASLHSHMLKSGLAARTNRKL